MSKIVNLDLDALLSGTVDDLADAPSIANWAPGTYTALLSMTMDNNKEKKTVAIKSTFVLTDVVELANAESTPPTAGDKFTVMDFWIHPKETVVEMGQGSFKDKAKALNERFGLRSNREVIEDTQNVEVLIVTGLRTVKGKNGEADREYMSVKSMAVV